MNQPSNQGLDELRKSKKQTATRNSVPLNMAILVRFSFILFFLAVFLVQIFYAISTTRAVKDVVTLENTKKASYYQAAINDPSLQSNLAAQVSQCDATIQKLEDDLDTSINIVSIACSISVLLTGLCTLNTLSYVKNQIANPLIKFHTEAEKMASGNLDVDFTTDSRSTEVYGLGIALQDSSDELQRVITLVTIALKELCNKNFTELPPAQFRGDFYAVETGFRDLVHIIATTLREIVISAEEVSVGAEQVSSGSQTLAEGATEQATSVDNLQEIIAEIAKMVADTAQSANEANNLGEEAEEVLKNSSKGMEELMAAINQIEQSSSDIEQIIKTIDDIAFQTNILALNAAIEAARAGQFGKSFAVVADEVRMLAQKSADAAHNTNGLIASSLEAIKRGATLAKSTNTAFDDVRDNSGRIQDVVRHIAESSNQQSESIDVVYHNVKQISSVIANNSATSEESAAASEQLSAQAEVMTDMLDAFQLENVRR